MGEGMFSPQGNSSNNDKDEGKVGDDLVSRIRTGRAARVKIA